MKTFFTLLVTTILTASALAESFNSPSFRDAITAGRSDIILEGEPITSGALPGSGVGTSVSIAAGHAVVGGIDDKVYWYQSFGTEWAFAQAIERPQQQANDVKFGYNVHLTEDSGQLFIAGAFDFGDGGALYPIVYRYQRPLVGGGPFTFVETITSFVRGDEFGTSMASQGNRLVIGNPGEFAGSIWIYLYDEASNTWARETILGNGFVNPNDMGAAVAIDGDRIVFSGEPISVFQRPWEIYVAELENGVWTTQNIRIQANNNNVDVGFGKSLALRGRKLFAGAPDHGTTGAVYRLELAGDFGHGYLVYDDETIVPTTGSPGSFGDSIAVVDDMMVVGSSTSSGGGGDGYCYIYSEDNPASSNSDWSELKHFSASGSLGTSVAFDGCQAIVGRPGIEGASSIGLLPSQAFRTQLYDGANAPFKYIGSVYEDDGTGTNTFRKNRAIASLYDSDDRTASLAIEAQIKQELVSLSGQLPALHPGQLWDLILDVNYDRTVADLLLGKDITSNLDRIRLENGAPGSFVLDNEVTAHEEALTAIRVSLSGYINLLEDRFGFNGWNAGYSILNSRVPTRRLHAPEVDGIPVSTANGVLMTGYKDYGLILQALRDHTYAAIELGRLYRLQNTTDSIGNLQNLISDTLRFTFENRSIFAELWSNANREALGLDEYDADLDAALTELTALHQGDVGGANPLGFEEDFLMLTRAEGQVFDSFNRFRDILGGPDACLVFDINQLSGRLGAAISEQDLALSTYDDYKEKQSTLASQFDLMTNTSGSAILPRLTEIVGVPYPIESPSDLDDPTHPYHFPESNQGGEMSQQRTSIDIAINRIERNRVEIENLNERIRIEVDRRAAEAGINASISNIYVHYGNEQARLTEELAAIEAVQGVATQLAGAVALAAAGPVGLAIGAATAINAGIQAGGDVAKISLEGEKERLAGQEKADVREKEDDILQANHEALIATILLEMKTLALDSREASLLLRQEVGRLVGLHAEKGDLERRLAGTQQSLAASYFANPVHRLRATNSALRAHKQFADAQRWMFFALRSLEYKWNEEFAISGRSADDLFRARNARELGEFFYDLCTFDDVRSTERITQGDWFSIKEDYFGYVFGETYLVTDPVTGQQFGPLSPEDAFRKQLEFHTVGDQIELDFSTVRSAGLTFFKDDRYLDKIDWVKVRIPGNHSGINPSRPETAIATIDLFYGGISVIRQRNKGTATDRDDRVANEFTTYNTRNWFFNNDSWQSQEGLLHTTGQAFLDTDPVRPFSANCADIMPTVLQIDTFKERSIATTGWRISVGVGGGSNDANLEEIDDIELYFCHKNLQRPQ